MVDKKYPCFLKFDLNFLLFEKPTLRRYFLAYLETIFKLLKIRKTETHFWCKRLLEDSRLKDKLDWFSKKKRWLKPNEKFTNDSLYKLSFVNFSLGFNHLFFFENQSSLSFNLESSKSLLHQKWVSVFRIFKSLKIVSKYARKYRRRVGFSKRRKFKSNFKKQGYFLSTKSGVFKPQKLFFYPFKSRLNNSQQWSYSVNKARVSPVMSRYGAYLNRINSLSKKFKSKVRVFSLNSFKNKLNLNFDKSKFNLSYNIYFRKFFKESFSNAYKYKRSLNQIKKDRFVKVWDKKQFYANPVNRFIRNNKNRQMSSVIYTSRRGNNVVPASRGVNNRAHLKRKSFYRPKFNIKN